MHEITLNGYYTLIAATLVLLVGKFMVRKIKFLRDFSIPEPVAGGLLAAAAVLVLHNFYGIVFNFETSLQDAFMLVFFSSIGLSADFSRLKQGGLPLVIFLVVVSAFIVLQNMVGMGMAYALGQNPLMGLITGSITLTGGPVARRLIAKMGRKPAMEELADCDTAGEAFNDSTFEDADRQRLITADSAIETMALFAACLTVSSVMTDFMTAHSSFKLPQFVWAIACGVILRNVLTTFFKFDMFDRAIDVFGNASLSIFLAIALMSMKLWQLADLAGPMIIILLVQTVVMILYAYFVTARVMGGDYDASILAAGHCGFGLGATPTAVANMQSVTAVFGPSHKAFLIVPLVGAFFVDFINAGILAFIVNLFGH